MPQPSKTPLEKGKIDKSMISGPQAGSFKHVAHIGYDADDQGFSSSNVDESWHSLVRGVQCRGLPAEVIRENEFIQDFAQAHKESVNEGARAPKKKPPPPPVPRRSAHATSNSVASIYRDEASSSRQVPLGHVFAEEKDATSRKAEKAPEASSEPQELRNEGKIDRSMISGPQAGARAPKKKPPPPPVPRRSAHATSNSVASIYRDEASSSRQVPLEHVFAEEKDVASSSRQAPPGQDVPSGHRGDHARIDASGDAAPPCLQVSSRQLLPSGLRSAHAQTDGDRSPLPIANCIGILEETGDEVSSVETLDTTASYAAALSSGSLTPDTVLTRWARTILTDRTAREALDAGSKLRVPMFDVCRAICIILEDGRLTEVVATLRLMRANSSDHISANNRRARWERGFREHCVKKLVKLGDIARDAEEHNDAFKYYLDALSLHPIISSEILLRRSNELIVLDPSCHIGYEQKHAALHGLARYTEAFEAFQLMLLKLGRSRESRMRELCHQYVDVTSKIEVEVEETIRHLPTVLIDTDTGCLYNKARQAAAFKELPIYDELRSSMTTALDGRRIREKVREFYRYVMFSHKWQPGEPTLQQVENNSVYNLPSSPTFDKLRNFCKLVVTLQYKWAWSDTCCVNQLDKGVQQESIVAMFRWYRRSSLTIVHLLGVLSESQEAGCLWRSIWNTRGWTYQEYVASQVVQFYTEDWKPYLGLQMVNHKESPVVLLEMERATNVSTQRMIILQPGLDRAREKLYLASGRQTTREEDMAYSLFGIFGVALPVVYGEGNLAIGRLLEHILARSDEVTLLAWTGHSGNEHSYLPATLTVYNEIVPPHVPAPIEATKMDRTVSTLRSSIRDLSLVVDLYKCLYDLPPLSLVAGRLKLPGIVFRLDGLSRTSESDPEPNMHVYRTTTPLLGDVEIKTSADLSGMSGLCLIHPWISPLIDRDFSRGEALFDLRTQALRLLVWLGQPFGGLLLALSARERYRRVATDSLIMVQVWEEAPLSELIDAVCTVNIQ